jgi:phosphoserine phosphatase
MKHVVVFDFDKTLTYKDTLLGFFVIAGRERAFFLPKLMFYLFSMVQAKTGLISNTKLKERGVALFLKNLSVEKIQKYAKAYSRHIVFNKLYHSLQYAPNTHYIIVSASFEEYLRPLFPDFVEVIGSRLAYENDSVSGLEFNCYQKEKIKALSEKGIDSIDLLYTDSFSDYALAKIAKKIVIVEKDKVTECKSIEAFREYFQK